VRVAAELSPSELEDLRSRRISCVRPARRPSNGSRTMGPSGPMKSAETAFLSEQTRAKRWVSLRLRPVASEDEWGPGGCGDPIAIAGRLVNRVPGHPREVLDDLFRLDSSGVRTKKHLVEIIFTPVATGLFLKICLGDP